MTFTKHQLHVITVSAVSNWSVDYSHYCWFEQDFAASGSFVHCRCCIQQTQQDGRTHITLIHTLHTCPLSSVAQNHRFNDCCVAQVDSISDCSFRLSQYRCTVLNCQVSYTFLVWLMWRPPDVRGSITVTSIKFMCVQHLTVHGFACQHRCYINTFVVLCKLFASSLCSYCESWSTLPSIPDVL